MCFLFSGFRFGFRFGSGKNGTHGKFRFGKLQIQISMTSEFATCQIWIWDLFLPQTKIILPFHLFHLRLLWTENVRQKMFGRKCLTDNVWQKMLDRKCSTENVRQNTFNRKLQKIFTEIFWQQIKRNPLSLWHCHWHSQLLKILKTFWAISCWRVLCLLRYLQLVSLFREIKRK